MRFKSTILCPYPRFFLYRETHTHIHFHHDYIDYNNYAREFSTDKQSRHGAPMLQQPASWCCLLPDDLGTTLNDFWRRPVLVMILLQHLIDKGTPGTPPAELVHNGLHWRWGPAGVEAASIPSPPSYLTLACRQTAVPVQLRIPVQETRSKLWSHV